VVPVVAVQALAGLVLANRPPAVVVAVVAVALVVAVVAVAITAAVATGEA
jgi:hypothetical protein